MKIAFYLPNKNCHKDCKNVDLGNPGIGGTEYTIIALAYHLSISNNRHTIYLLAHNVNNLPNACNTLQANNITEILSICKEKQIDCLVIQNSPETNQILYQGLDDIKIVVWAHSFMSRKQWNLYARSSNVKRIVCVGNEELEQYCDHRAYKKSVVIFNPFPLPNIKSQIIPFSQRKNEVTFLASIVPHTNFHLLAKIWKEVLESVPDAHLNVIGSGNLYNNTKRLGKYRIAEEEYEKKFMPYLLDQNGKLLSSVTFWGKLGNEKNQILKRTKIGVANPGGYETFCISAVEMQLYGAKVISKKKGGLLDSIYDKDNLFTSEKDFVDYIIKGLKSTDLDYNHTFEFLQLNFSFKVIEKQWLQLFSEVECEVPVRPVKLECKNVTIVHRLRYFNKKIKMMLPFGYRWMPTVKFYEAIWNRIKSLFL